MESVWEFFVARESWDLTRRYGLIKYYSSCCYCVSFRYLFDTPVGLLMLGYEIMANFFGSEHVRLSVLWDF